MVDLDVMVDRVFIEYQCYQGPRASGSQTIDLLRAAKIHTGGDNLPPIDPLSSPLRPGLAWINPPGFNPSGFIQINPPFFAIAMSSSHADSELGLGLNICLSYWAVWRDLNI